MISLSLQSMHLICWYQFAMLLLPLPFLISPKIQFLATRKRVTLSTPPCRIPKYVFLLCDVVPTTLSLIHLSFTSSLIVSSICPECLCFLIIQRFLSYAFSMSKKIATVFSFLLKPSKIFVVILDILFIMLLQFSETKLLSIFFSFIINQIILLIL